MGRPAANLECIWQARALLGEGPVWDVRDNALYWVDIKAPSLHRYVPASGAKQTWPMPEPIGCVAPRRRGGFVAALKSGFAFLDPDHGRLEPIENPEPHLPDNRFNDGKCDAQGRFWAGSMDDREREKTGWLYRLNPDLSWQRMDGGYICTNGPAFSPDGKTAYHTDTLGRTIYAFDLSEVGDLANKRVFAHIAETDGFPDGMSVDADGGVWVCHWGGWRVTRFTPCGIVDRTIALPVAQVTSCAFGGPDFATLFITTAAIGLDEAALRGQALAGGVFAIQPGVRGLPAPQFAG